MQKFIINIIISVLSNEKVQQMIKDLIGGIITERVLPLVPVAVTAAVDAAIKQIPGVENLKDVSAVADHARDALNKMIPDIDLPVIGDLTDFWRPKA